MSPERINQYRGVTVWAARAIAVLLLGLGSYLMLKRVVMAVVTRDVQAAFLSWEEIGEGHSLYRGLAMLTVGGVLFALSTDLARWIIRVMPEGCPRCGYEKVETERCPECGLGGFRQDEKPF